MLQQESPARSQHARRKYQGVARAGELALLVLAALHEGHEHAEEAILLVEVAALAREVLDHLEGLVEARERGVLPCLLKRLLCLKRTNGTVEGCMQRLPTCAHDAPPFRRASGAPWGRG